MDSQGKVIASSNRDAPGSFVGKNYAFRPYFQEALSGKPAGYLAAGVTSLERGFYAACSVADDSGRVWGVIAIKKNVDAIKDILAAYPTSFLINPDGVIFMSGSRDMVFKSLWPVSPERARELKDSQQFGRETFEPVFDRPVYSGERLQYHGETYECFRNSVASPGWSLVLWVSTKEISYFSFLGWSITGSVAFIVVLLTFWAAAKLKTEEALRESQERFRAAFESSGIGMALVDPEGRWIQANASLCRIVGYTEEELQQKTFQEITHSDDLEADLAQVQRLLAGHISHYTLEKRYFHKKGHIIWVLLTVSLVRGQRKEPLYFVSQIEDITARKATEEKLQQKVVELERFNRIAVGRELKMIELKTKLQTLEKGGRPA
jgi:PAS domain S-box-containing protein